MFIVWEGGSGASLPSTYVYLIGKLKRTREEVMGLAKELSNRSVTNIQNIYISI